MGRRPRGKGKGTLGDFYLKKAGNCVIELKGATKGVTDLHLEAGLRRDPGGAKAGGGDRT